MKKFVKGLAVLGVMASLVSCATKTDFATFKEKADAAVKLDMPYTKATVKGTIKTDDTTEKINLKFTYETLASVGSLSAKAWKTDSTSAAAVALTVILNSNVTAAYANEKNENATFYAGSTFKLVIETENGKSETKWNKYGQVTYMADGSSKYTISYSK